MIRLASPSASATVDPDAGGRITSLVVEGHELLVDAGDDPLMWGCYPMVPFAGRLGDGRFRFESVEHQLPATMGPHAIHGYGYVSPWTVEPDGSLMIAFGDPWPLGGWARQRFVLEQRRLTCTIEVGNDERPMPAQAGWHPWYRRPVSVELVARSRYVRDDRHLPTGELTEPGEGPFDDCFVGVRQPVVLAFDGGPRVEVTSTCDHWVLYDRPEHAVCVEPQSGPPDGFRLRPEVVRPGAPLVSTMTLRW